MRCVNMKTVLIDRDGNFCLYKNIYPIKTRQTSHGYYCNTKTGENCGKNVEIYKGDEDCYELILENENAE